jgi:hypothetical protein
MPTVVLIGTLDTKGEEYCWIRDQLVTVGCEMTSVDVGTSVFELNIDDLVGWFISEIKVSGRFSGKWRSRGLVQSGGRADGHVGRPDRRSGTTHGQQGGCVLAVIFARMVRAVGRGRPGEVVRVRAGPGARLPGSGGHEDPMAAWGQPLVGAVWPAVPGFRVA